MTAAHCASAVPAGLLRAGGLLSVLLAALVAGCAHSRLKVGAAKDGEVVEAEGWAAVDKADALGTRRRALVEAQKKAVEQVVGVFISAKTRVAQAVSVDENILAKVAGYVGKYDVLGEREEEGFHKTRIRALVLYKKLGEDLKELGLVRPPPPAGNPKVVVLIRTSGGAADPLGDRAAGGARRGLLERGFLVIDRNDPLQFSDRKSTDSATAAAVGSKLGADLVVAGSAEVHPIADDRLGGFKSFRARVSVEVVKPATGEVVSSKSQEASAIDPAADVAAGKALESAGLLAGEAVAAELSSLLKSRVGVTMTVEGLADLDAVRSFAEDLRGQPDVAAVTLSTFQGLAAEFQVSTDDLAGDELAAVALRMKKYNFNVRSATPYEVTLETR